MLPLRIPRMEKKVLIIAYYWPPSGGSGVQRWLKFVKYLPELGWQPYVFTPENPSFGIQDQSLLKDVPPEAEVIHFPIWEPYEAFFKLSSLVSPRKSTGSAALLPGKEMSFFQRFSTWIRGNLLIPDPRVFWVRPSVKFLNDFLRENEIKTIVTTGPPHSIHLIGYRLKRKNPHLKWLADFRDPWSEWGLLDSLGAGRVARRIHRKLEAKVLQLADHIVTITPFYVRQFEALSNRKVNLLTNGYDQDDFKRLKIEPTEKFVIRHVGIVNEKCDPRPFMNAVQQLAADNDLFRSSIQVDFVGEVHPQFKSFVEHDTQLSAFTTFTPPIAHSDLILLYGKSSVLLLVLTGYKDAEGYMPGKLFEYLATTVPIVGIGPENGDASDVLRELGSGGMIDGAHVEKIKKRILELFHNWKNGSVVFLRHASTRFSRKEITGQLTELL
jgi:glycosyltransferase involved in cell wall biosynthesis